MEKLYTEKDIKEFLLKNGILWNGEKFENTSYNGIPALVGLFGKNGNFEVYLDIEYLNFKIYYQDCNICYQETTYYKKLYKDLSSNWISYLISKYPKVITLMHQIIEKEKQLIITNANKDIAPLKQEILQIKHTAKKKIQKLDNLKISITKNSNINIDKTK